jgi:hypothetical protein
MRQSNYLEPCGEVRIAGRREVRNGGKKVVLLLLRQNGVKNYSIATDRLRRKYYICLAVVVCSLVAVRLAVILPPLAIDIDH